MYHRLVFSVALALISLAVLAGTTGIYSSGAPPTVPAASRASSTLTVTSTGDSGPGSLRQAIADASPGDTIVFAVTGIIVLTTGELSVNKDLIIEGPGADNLAINGNSASRVFSIQGAVVSISDITVGTGASH